MHIILSAWENNSLNVFFYNYSFDMGIDILHRENELTIKKYRIEQEFESKMPSKTSRGLPDGKLKSQCN